MPQDVPENYKEKLPNVQCLYASPGIGEPEPRAQKDTPLPFLKAPWIKGVSAKQVELGSAV